MPAGKAGRKSKLTPERRQKITELIRHGNYIEVAAAATGIDQRTYYHWMAIGKTLNESYGPDAEDWPTTLTQYERDCAQFFQDVRKATAEAEASAVLAIKTHFPTQWAAAMTFLERRHPGRWKRRDELAVNPFEPGTQGQTSIDETALLQDPQAVALMHQALELVAGEGTTDRGEGLQRAEVESPVVPQVHAPDSSGN